jgi:hypothetical protein
MICCEVIQLKRNWQVTEQICQWQNCDSGTLPVPHSPHQAHSGWRPGGRSKDNLKCSNQEHLTCVQCCVEEKLVKDLLKNVESLALRSCVEESRKASMQASPIPWFILWVRGERRLGGHWSPVEHIMLYILWICRKILQGIKKKITHII